MSAKVSPATEVITRETGASVRRIRKLRVTILASADAKDQGKTFAFAQDEVRVGSSAETDVPINDPAISREHLTIRLVRDGFLVEDAASTNGTFIGDLAIKAVVAA